MSRSIDRRQFIKEVSVAAAALALSPRIARADRRGAINLEWDANTNLLLARVITRGQGKPSLIIGDFVHLLMSKYRKRIQAINIIPRG